MRQSYFQRNQNLAKEERIRAIAYSLLEEEDRPDGRAEEHWLRASGLVAAVAEPAPALPADPPEPDWLRREAVAVAEMPVQPETGETRDKLAKRAGGMKAA